MIPYNLLLLPLIAGYFALVYSVFFKYNTQRFTQNRLIFEAIFFSIIILFICLIFRTGVEYFCPTVIPRILDFLKVIPIRRVDYLWTGVFSFVITIGFVLISNLIVLIIYGKSRPIRWAVKKNGDEIEKLFEKSASEGVLLQVTLKNNKVYIGFSEIIPIPQKTNYLILTPVISGYRESETKKLIITTDYFDVIDQYMTGIDNKESITLNTDVIIRQDEILTAGIYEQDIFDKFNKSNELIK